MILAARNILSNFPIAQQVADDQDSSAPADRASQPDLPILRRMVQETQRDLIQDRIHRR